LVLAPAGQRLAVCRTPAPTMGLIPENSLAGKMFGTLADGIGGLAKSMGVEDKPAEPTEADIKNQDNAVAADLDARAQSGEITFQDFLTISQSFMQMDKVGGMSAALPGQLTDAEIAETRQKIAKHEKIVDVMLEEERLSPQLLVEDVKAGGAVPGPRLQRLAKASGQPESEVALFVMQFEAMRESTKRIAAGEDPDKVNESMMAGPDANRQARRAAKKASKKKAKNKV